MAVLTSRWAQFNSWNFNNVAGLSVTAIDPPGQAQRKLNLLGFGRISGRKLASGFYTSAQMKIKVYIARSTRELLEASIDTLLKNIQGTEGAIVVPVSGSVRQYTGTFASLQYNTLSGGYAEITLTFELSDSFGYDTNYTVIQAATNVTGSPFNFGFNQGGSADVQVPIIQAKVTAVTGGSNASIIIGNSNTGQFITVTRTWAVNDLLIVDCQNNKVTVNGVDVTFSGAFPTVGTGAQQLYYQDGFTTRTTNLFAYVYNRYS